MIRLGLEEGDGFPVRVRESHWGRTEPEKRQCVWGGGQGVEEAALGELTWNLREQGAEVRRGEAERT